GRQTHRWSTATWSAGTTSSCSTARRSRRAPPAGCARRGPRASVRSPRRSRRLEVVCAGGGLAALAIPFQDPSFEEQVTDALVMGVRDYAARCGFRTAVVGLSGGGDSGGGAGAGGEGAPH